MATTPGDHGAVGIGTEAAPADPDPGSGSGSRARSGRGACTGTDDRSAGHGTPSGARPLIPATPPAHGRPLFHATLRAVPEDFRVDERLEIAFAGSGEHLWLRLEKRLMNTADVVSLLERAYAVGSADVGVSGLKDRRAVTRQWFSVRTPADTAPLEAAIARPRAEAADGGEEEGTSDAGGASLALIDSARHTRKLRRGAHAANAFDITLRDVVAASDGLDAELSTRVERLRAEGFPNYLGPQRFGRDGANLVRARAWFRSPKRRASRLQRGLWLSAARSALFNRVCAARVADGSWSRALDGEPLVLDGTRSFFVPDVDRPSEAVGPDRGHLPSPARESDPVRDDAFANASPEGARPAERDAGRDAGSSTAADAVASRLDRGDVHPSGPWWGRGTSPAGGACERLERALLEDAGDFRDGLERAGLEQGRRALRAFPRELGLERRNASTLRLSFVLGPGVFATTLLAELGTFTTAGEG